MTATAFISHTTKDVAIYATLCAALDSSGVQRWDVARLPLGQPLAKTLRGAIEECDVCVFVATSRSITSPWCLAELGAFWGANKRVIIFRAEPEIKEAELPPQFQGDLWTDDIARLVDEITGPGDGLIRVLDDGYSASLGSLTVTVRTGRIEQQDCSATNCLVALPANEFFDDECIHDPRSALGAYLQHHFEGRIEAIQALVQEQLEREPTQDVEKQPGVRARSFGIGKCVYLRNPLSSHLHVGLVAVTTQRSDVGLTAEASYIFKAAASLQRIMANNRLSVLRIPILGSGHGGLKPELSLVLMLIAFGEFGARQHKSPIKEVDIVVFQRDGAASPSISPRNIRGALRFAEEYF